MKRLLPSALTLLTFVMLAPLIAAQSPYPSLSFVRESNNEQTTDYVLKPEQDEIQKRLGGADKPYRIVGALARPSKQMAVLLFVNSQKAFELGPQADKSVRITVDTIDIGNLKYEVVASDELPTAKLEIGNVLIGLDDLRKVANGTSVTIRMGTVVHQLDRDNLAALKYLIDEIDKDVKTAN